MDLTYNSIYKDPFQKLIRLMTHIMRTLFRNSLDSRLKNKHLNQFYFWALNRSHTRDLGAIPLPKCSISRRASFCKNTPKSAFNNIYDIDDFRIHIPKIDFSPKCLSHLTRPAARPSDTQSISPDTQNISPDT